MTSQEQCFAPPGKYYICDPFLLFTKVQLKKLELIKFSVEKTGAGEFYVDNKEDVYTSKSGYIALIPYELINTAKLNKLDQGSSINSTNPVPYRVDDTYIYIGDTNISTWEILNTKFEMDMLSILETLRD